MQSVYNMLNTYQEQNEVVEYEENGRSELVATLLNQKEASKVGIAEKLKNLFCSAKHCVSFYKSMILFVVTNNLFYMSVFMIAKSEGSPFTNFIIFGLGLSTGIFSSGLLLQIIEDAYIYLLSLCLILTVNLTRIESEEPSVVMISCLMFLQAFGCGILSNS